MKLFCLVNQFTISRLFTFLRKYQKTKVLKRTITAKINNIKKQRYNLLIFQKTEKKEFSTYIACIIILTIYFQSVLATH